MKIKNNIKIISLTIIVLNIFPNKAQAVMPPDFIFNIGTQIIQIFSMIVLFFSTILGIVWQFLSNRLGLVKYKKICLVFFIIFIIIISFSISYLYVNYEKKVQYDKWLKEYKSNAKQ